MHRVNKRHVGIAAVSASLAAVFVMAGCQGSNTRDLENVKGKDPKKAELYINVDQHPNIVRLCIDGVAFVTTSRKEDVIIRVPEFDAWCKS